jgi:hypothetical protein
VQVLQALVSIEHNVGLKSMQIMVMDVMQSLKETHNVMSNYLLQQNQINAILMEQQWNTLKVEWSLNSREWHIGWTSSNLIRLP